VPLRITAAFDNARPESLRDLTHADKPRAAFYLGPPTLELEEH
jgi:hypothetical protein